MILIILKFSELLLRISPRIINSLRSYIKHSKECFLLFINTSKFVKKTRLHLVFPTYFSAFGNRRKHSSSCLIYYVHAIGFSVNSIYTLNKFKTSENASLKEISGHASKDLGFWLLKCLGSLFLAVLAPTPETARAHSPKSV